MLSLHVLLGSHGGCAEHRTCLDLSIRADPVGEVVVRLVSVFMVLFWGASFLRHYLALYADLRCNLRERICIILHTVVVLVVGLELKLVVDFLGSGARINDHVEGRPVSSSVVSWEVLDCDLIDIRADPDVVNELAVDTVLAVFNQVCVLFVTPNGVVPDCRLHAFYHLDRVELHSEVVVRDVASGQLEKAAIVHLDAADQRLVRCVHCQHVIVVAVGSVVVHSLRTVAGRNEHAKDAHDQVRAHEGDQDD